MVLHAQPSASDGRRSSTAGTRHLAVGHRTGAVLAGGAAAQPVPADRRLRLPVRLREHLPDLVGRLGGVAVRAAARTPRACSGRSWTAAPGHFRLGPYGVSVPAARRYLPGSLILETTWQTHTGWLIVRDALVMGPWHDIETRSRTHRRTPMDWDAEHILLRTVRCVSGTVELVMSCEPSFDYHRDQRDAGSTRPRPTARRSRARPRIPDAHPTLRLTTNLRIGLEGREARARTRLTEGDNVFVALSWSKHPGAADLRRGRRQDVEDQRVLAAVDQHRRLPRPSVAVVPAAQRADAEGPDLLADRRAAGRPAPRRCRKPLRANATGTTAMRGCATRRSRCGACTPWAWTARPTTSSRSSPTCPAPTTVNGIRCR